MWIITKSAANLNGVYLRKSIYCFLWPLWVLSQRVFSTISSPPYQETISLSRSRLSFYRMTPFSMAPLSVKSFIHACDSLLTKRTVLARCQNTPFSKAFPLVFLPSNSYYPYLNFQSTRTVTTIKSCPKSVPVSLWEKLHLQLHKNPQHPIGIIKQKLIQYFESELPLRFPELLPTFTFDSFVNFPLIIPSSQNFDDLLISEDHVSRLSSETFYADDLQHFVIRTQSTAHQPELLRKGYKAAIWSTVVARKDEIDFLHYPIFHQFDGYHIWDSSSLPTASKLNLFFSKQLHWNINEKTNPFNSNKKNAVVLHLQCILEGLIDYMFGKDCPRRWDYAPTFPFTLPSLEMEIYHNGSWVEILGAGAIKQEILQSCGIQSHQGWAFGMGIERMAMILFEIPDIRLFWAKDSRFHEQFTDGKIKRFVPYSKHPPVFKDVAFWVPADFEKNSLYQLFRESAGDILESVKVIDVYHHPTDNRLSLCYRLIFRSFERTLTNEEINILHRNLINKAVQQLGLVER
ncbi:Ferredoxin-fold anticodon binding domain-containing protein [Cardiosporidium cionae]|uniref:phenylalanine--tRNA ligase n=1 Tax=Cardiosporidium cionae TaxID=476202 RepID=A0ABQ7JBE4_9APIC|nr:Ferredoxin-fold anticodon binding domain-containing protein [Cardiosporidium cionae]|eukprot:KAF8821327.1 Ferredoxin-fold anticodon binding domain-containing protein [Cardiosporidium cionae]